MAARIQAYDVHIDAEYGHVHFQVLVEESTDREKILGYAVKHLQLNEIVVKIKEDSVAKLGHNQGATAEQEKQIKDVGYAILKVHPA